MKRLQDAGYNDIFIPSMIELSPAYKRYHDALTAINQRPVSYTHLDVYKRQNQGLKAAEEALNTLIPDYH